MTITPTQFQTGIVYTLWKVAVVVLLMHFFTCGWIVVACRGQLIHLFVRQHGLHHEQHALTYKYLTTNKAAFQTHFSVDKHKNRWRRFHRDSTKNAC